MGFCKGSVIYNITQEANSFPALYQNSIDDRFLYITFFCCNQTEFTMTITCCPLQQADESLDFEEQILEAAKSIAAATSALVKSASAAQRELVAQGKVGKH